MTDSQLYPKQSSVWVVIPAAGSGQRMQSDIPKQYLKIDQKTILQHTIECFLNHQQIAGIVVVLQASDPYWQSLNIHSDSYATPLFTVDGGADRSMSVSNGLDFLLKQHGVDEHQWVMVHDAARPCLSQNDLDSLLSISKTDACGGLLATPVRDTMKRADNVLINDVLINDAQMNDDMLSVSHTESREGLWHALTPQLFRLGALKNALTECAKNNFDVTDESSAMEYVGEHPVIVECVDNNIKVTQANDMAFATFLLSEKAKGKLDDTNR